jgi:nitroimidazol reductase NimA-like FMN-containing flavoprotein (pyridoxamine 5'-phosphate oxidase superfamily)
MGLASSTRQAGERRSADRQRYRKTRRARMDREERRQFVREHRTCIFGYSRKEHGPAMTVVYYVVDRDDLLVSTMAARGKAKAVARDQRVSLCILDEKWPLSYLQVYGSGVVDTDPALAADVLTRVIGLMAGEEVPESRRPQITQLARDEDRVVIRVRPYATFETPPRHVYKMSDIDTLTHFTSTSLPW